MVYDAIIIGAGIAGLSCAIKMRQLGKTCIVLEKTSLLISKPCGGGVTNRALSLLNTLNIQIDELLNLDAKVIKKSYQIFDENVKVFDYTKQSTAVKCAVGIDRHSLDSILVNHAMNEGAVIIKNCHVKEISYGTYVQVDKYLGRTVVIATGGFSSLLPNKPICTKSLGISMDIEAEMDFENDAFYFYFLEKYAEGYAWIFPNGTNKWNIGVWQKKDFNRVKTKFKQFSEIIFDEKAKCIVHKKNPKIGFICCGDNAEFKKENNTYYIGECIGFASDQTGEGIYHAILSGSLAANDIAKSVI